MSTPKGWSSQQKEERTKAEFTTLSQIGPNKWGLDVAVSMYHQLINDGDLVDAVIIQDNGDIYSITVTGHGAKPGDLVYFKSGALVNRQIRILEVPDANTIVFAETFTSSGAQPAATDEIDILSPIMPRTNSEGDLVISPGAIAFILDGAPQEVTEDTLTPSNNAPLPVKITSTTGDINITAGDLNVQTSHIGVNHDSMRIGDGTETVNINASNEMQVADDIARTTLSVIEGKLVQNQQANASSLAVVLSTTQEAIFTSIDSSLNSIEVKDFATEATLTSLNNKVNVGQQNNANSVAVSLSTEQQALLTSLDGKDFATQTTLAAVLADLQLKANLTETQPVSLASQPLPTGAATEATLAALEAKLNSLGQKTSANSAPVVLSSEQEALIDGLEALLTSIDGKDFSTETTLAALNAKFGSLGQKASSGSAPVVLSTAQETILSNIEANGALDVVQTDIINLSGQDDSTWTQLIASTSSAIKKASIFMSSGRILEIATGAAAAEVRKFLVAPGGYPGQPIEVDIPAGTRLSYRFVSGEGTGAAGERAVINWQG